jgi:hypothetical protein
VGVTQGGYEYDTLLSWKPGKVVYDRRGMTEQLV